MSRSRRVNNFNRVVKKRFRAFLVFFFFLFSLFSPHYPFFAVGEPYILVLTFFDLFRSRNFYLSFLSSRNLDPRLLSFHYNVDFNDYIKSSNCRAKISILRELTF